MKEMTQEEIMGGLIAEVQRINDRDENHYKLQMEAMLKTESIILGRLSFTAVLVSILLYMLYLHIDLFVQYAPVSIVGLIPVGYALHFIAYLLAKMCEPVTRRLITRYITVTKNKEM